MGPALDDIVAPPRTPGWKVTRAKDPKNESEVVVTASRTFAAGETLSDDLALKAPLKKDAPKGTLPTVFLGNTLSVRTLPDGKLEYREVIRWRGAKPKELANPDPEMMAMLALSVPALDKAARATVATHLRQNLWQTLFGPGEPILGLLLTHSELGEFKLKKRLGEAVESELKAALGEKLTEAERRAAVLKIIGSLSESVKDKTKQQANAGPAASGGNDDTLVALLIKAKLPGKLISTNGEQDPATGEIVWGLFAQAPAAGDVILTAVCEPASR
jgi:hypothetical protein